jgi:putative cardiolipin synthase
MKKQISAILTVCLLIVSVASADKLIPVETDRHALAARYYMVKSAQKEIIAQYFHFGRDPIALNQISLMQEAARRGVSVKLIVDNMHNDLTRADMAALLEVQKDPSLRSKFEIKVFNPLAHILALPELTYRDHSKRMIIDGEVLLIGGRNTAAGYFGEASKNSTEPDNFVDFEVMLEGKAAVEAREDFLKLWDLNKMITVPESSERI